MNSVFDSYQKVQAAVENHLREVKSESLSLVDAEKRFMEFSTHPSRAESESEIDARRKRVAELESRIKKSRKGKERSRAGADSNFLSEFQKLLGIHQSLRQVIEKARSLGAASHAMVH